MLNISEEELDFANDLLDFIHQSPTPYHAVSSMQKQLKKFGFKELKFTDEWDLQIRGKYYITQDNGTIFAFILNSTSIKDLFFRIITGHTDSPSIRIKPSANMVVEKNYLKLNVEPYGGLIVNTWLDRPLSLAGRLFLKGENAFSPITKLINIPEAVAVIPNLAIHFNKEINKGIEINKQKELTPLIANVEFTDENSNKRDYLLEKLSDYLHIDKEQILNFELHLYSTQRGTIAGWDNEYIISPRLDNLSMVHASLNALCNSTGTSGINMIAAFDHEEIGSNSRSGADSTFFSNLLEKIVYSLNGGRLDFFNTLKKSFVISADLAHALHPNKTDVNDPTNRPVLNKGPVIKLNSNQKYATDHYTASVYQSICKDGGIPYQNFVVPSDMTAGSTLGPVLSSQLDLTILDIGNPILAMHSINETGGVKDHSYIYESFLKFFEV